VTASYFEPTRIAWTNRPRTWRAYYQKNNIQIRLGALISLFVVVAVWPWVCITVPAGHVAVEWYRFVGGTDVEHVLPEGARFIFPWDKLAIYDTRIQQLNRDIDVLSSDGLTIGVDVAVRFRVNPATVGILHKKVGPDYAEKLLLGAVASYARTIFSRNTTDEIYAGRRPQIQDEIKHAVSQDLLASSGATERPADGWIMLDEVLIRGMRFPPSVQSAINRKMEEYQLKQEYAYRIEREQLESQRKAIEAAGIARFQATVSTGISDAYLRWRGIEATLALAQSPNAKTVVIGGGRDSLPIILGDGAASDASVAKKPPGPDVGDVRGGAAAGAGKP
jgi:regulator of protease activity HflC (stomatin/prohibitin superfamily)